MAEQLSDHGEYTMQQTLVQEAAQLSFGRGKVGQRYPLIDDSQKVEFARECAEHTVMLTKTNTADCGDERLTVSLADGITDENVLQRRITPQLFGGLGLSVTKAMVAADSPSIKDAKTFWEAYLTVSEMLAAMGEEDGGHAGCGAAGSVEASVNNAIAHEILVPSVGLLVADNGSNSSLLQMNTDTKHNRLQSGFYGEWNAKNHEDYLIDRFPQNFSYLKDDPNDPETHGHNGSGLYIVTKPGVGYQKTGRAFAVTAPKMTDIAHRVGGSEQERRRILLGFVDDTLHVGAGIVTEGFPVFAQAA